MMISNAVVSAIFLMSKYSQNLAIYFYFSRFIMTDSESIVEYSSECESNSSDKSNDVQLIGEIMRNIGDEKIRHHSIPKNISNEHATYWHHPTTESNILDAYIYKFLEFRMMINFLNRSL